MKRKIELKMKYNKKVMHLETERKKELAMKRSKMKIPSEIEIFKDCNIFNEEKMALMAEAKINGLTIGDVELDDDELSILMLNPKFAVLVRLEDEKVEREIELGVTKLRYEIRKLLENKFLEDVKVDDTSRKKARIDESDKDESKVDEDG